MGGGTVESCQKLRLLPKLRAGTELNVSIALSAKLESAQAQTTVTEITQALEEFGVADEAEVKIDGP